MGHVGEEQTGLCERVLGDGTLPALHVGATLGDVVQQLHPLDGGGVVVGVCPLHHLLDDVSQRTVHHRRLLVVFGGAASRQQIAQRRTVGRLATVLRLRVCVGLTVAAPASRTLQDLPLLLGTLPRHGGLRQQAQGGHGLRAAVDVVLHKGGAHLLAAAVVVVSHAVHQAGLDVLLLRRDALTDGVEQLLGDTVLHRWRVGRVNLTLAARTVHSYVPLVSRLVDHTTQHPQHCNIQHSYITHGSCDPTPTALQHTALIHHSWIMRPNTHSTATHTALIHHSWIIRPNTHSTATHTALIHHSWIMRPNTHSTATHTALIHHSWIIRPNTHSTATHTALIHHSWIMRPNTHSTATHTALIHHSWIMRPNTHSTATLIHHSWIMRPNTHSTATHSTHASLMDHHSNIFITLTNNSLC